ncbi:GbsR/MarR family transcriptional regulator [Streptomyces sp. NPDC102441]|uniref:GbsR/MarR family transcriptional regulator n=1 Tax=Streptomyces sp. NPDC102441 TaxID=3366176 RepID=UPI00380469AD
MSQAAEGVGADAREALVEEFGMHVGRAMGWPPMAGRAAGLLMLSEEPMTLAELQDALDASKGSVSEMTRLLVTNGTVERYKAAGQRHFVYRWRDDAWAGCLRHIVASTTQLRELAEQAQVRGAGMTAVQQHRLGEMQEYYRFMVSHLESLLSEYTAAREPRGTQP